MSKFLNSLVKQDSSVINALAYLYQEVRKTNEFLGLKNSDALKETYFKLRKEEVGELFKAIEKGDKVEFLDAVVDGLVVVGYEWFSINNHKTEDYITVDDDYTIKYHIKNIVDCYDVKDLCNDTLGDLENIFGKLHINHMKAAQEVVASNNSKFPLVTELLGVLVLPKSMYVDQYTQEQLFDYQCHLITQKGRYTGIYWEVRKDSDGNDRVIFWAKGENAKDEDGNDIHIDYKSPKYIKPATFREPDFESCWLN